MLGIVGGHTVEVVFVCAVQLHHGGRTAELGFGKLGFFLRAQGRFIAAVLLVIPGNLKAVQINGKPFILRFQCRRVLSPRFHGYDLIGQVFHRFPGVRDLYILVPALDFLRQFGLFLVRLLRDFVVPFRFPPFRVGLFPLCLSLRVIGRFLRCAYRSFQKRRLLGIRRRYRFFLRLLGACLRLPFLIRTHDFCAARRVGVLNGIGIPRVLSACRSGLDLRGRRLLYKRQFGAAGFDLRRCRVIP